jgi:hypothetical protein
MQLQLYKNAKKGSMNQFQNSLRLIVLMTLLIMSQQQPVFSQGSAGSKAKMPRLSIIDMPTARILPPKAYRVSGIIMQESGILTQVNYGLTKNVNLGFSYSAMPLFGEGDPILQPLLLFDVRVRLLSEKKKVPAIVLGVNSQGLGAWENKRRFEFNAPGIFLSASKNISWEAGILSLHGGINYPIMPSAYSNTPGAFVGVEQSFYKNVTIATEYSGTWNEDPAFMNKNGLLNCAVKYSPFKGINLTIQARDLLESRANGNGFLRYAGIEYIGIF